MTWLEIIATYAVTFATLIFGTVFGYSDDVLRDLNKQKDGKGEKNVK